jgi:hemoglobin-like flavoprotein
VQSTFAQLEFIADDVAATFYRRLFELDPKLKPLFKADMQLQGVQFMEKLGVAVMGLHDLGAIAPLVQTLGRDHARYGVRPSDYETALEALLQTLEHSLGPAFDSELRSAWAAAFTTVSSEMIRAAESDGG